jgi:2-keto-4-pentenoate hydratase/2-oxohepta-3-ene-1,7-dioic acid hydratase in catechol pathway
VKLVLFARDGGAAQVGILTTRGVVPVERLEDSPQAEMTRVIDHFSRLEPALQRAADGDAAIPLAEVQLLPPLPRPGKILCSTATYASGESTARPPLLMTLKSAESVIGPGQTVQLPDVGPEWQFVAEAELGLVISGPAKRIGSSDWRTAVFGYTCVLDVMARGDTQFGRDFWLAKADTLGPLGPCIVTLDEVADPRALRVTSSVNGALAQDYSLATADYDVGELVEFATTVMTLYTGDVIACGTSRAGLRPLRGGDAVSVDIDAIGRLDVHVTVAAGVAA